MKVKWQGYLRRHPNSPGARLLLTIGGRTVSETAIKINAALKSGKIKHDTYSDRMEVLTEWREAYKQSGPVVDHHPHGNWIEVSPGGFQRRNHLSS